jgi:hypothetical protein
MLIVCQSPRFATSAASFVTWRGREQVFGGYHNVDPAGGSRTIKMSMLQILEPLTCHQEASR